MNDGPRTTDHEPQPPRAVLWDLDGTLIDSERDHFEMWRDVLHGEGHALSYESFVAFFGMRNDAFLRGVLGEDLPMPEVMRLSDDKEGRYQACVRQNGARLLPGAEAWVVRLKEAGWRQAIASSAPPLNIKAVLESSCLGQHIETVVSAFEISRGKPAPDIFLAAAARVQVPPARCIVVEDAAAGVEGARRAGMRVIGVRTTHAALEADHVVDTLEALAVHAFDTLLNGKA